MFTLLQFRALYPIRDAFVKDWYKCTNGSEVQMSAASPGWMHEVLGLVPSTTRLSSQHRKGRQKSGSSVPWARKAAQLVDCLPNPEFTPTTFIRCVPVNSSALYSWRQEDPQLHSKLRPTWDRRAPLSGAKGGQIWNKTLSREQTENSCETAVQRVRKVHLVQQ